MDSLVGLVTAILAVVGALLGLGQYFRFRSRKDKLTAIGQAFKDVVDGLGSPSEIQRQSSAALIRRFFDEKSEFSSRGLPYSPEAIIVVSATLRSEPTGNFQKLLADGLATAPSLEGADMQRANLTGCYWGKDRNGNPVNAQRADFFRADLTAASLRRANLSSAYFREARLFNAVLADTDCRKANFQGASLLGASFQGALLDQARFAGASDIPEPIRAHLDAEGVFHGVEPVTGTWDAKRAGTLRVFLSAPSAFDSGDSVAFEQVIGGLSRSQAQIVRFLPPDYVSSQPLLEITRRVRGCDAVIAFGAAQILIESGKWCRGSGNEEILKGVQLATPWNQVEAGIAMGLSMPLLLVKTGTSGGVFDLSDAPPLVNVIDATQPGNLSELDIRVANWVSGDARAFLKSEQ